MRLRVEYTGQLRAAVGRSNENVELCEGSTASDLLKHLAMNCPNQVRTHLVNSAGQFQPSLLVAINGTAFVSNQLGSAVLNEGDSIVLLPPIGGG